MAKQVYSYLRVSGKGQVEGHGFQRQSDAIRKFCKRKKLVIVQEFRDEGISGTKDGFDRDGLTELMLALKSNGIRTFVVENASRLARDLMIQEVILADCRKHGITVLDTSDVDLTVADGDPTRTLIRQVLGAVSQFEKSSLVQKLASSRRRIRKNAGKCEGRKSYVELEHPAVEVIKAMRSKRRPVSFQKIADHLNEKGIPTLKDGNWKYQQVQQVWNSIKAA